MSNPALFEEIYTRLSRQLTQNQIADFQTDSAWYLFAGVETRQQGDDYYNHGLRRSGDSAYPFLIFQFTLGGAGAFELDGKVYPVETGQAFITTVPSDHSYYLPAHSPSWSFFWLGTFHPYIVSRLKSSILAAGPILTIAPETRLLSRSLTLWEEQHGGAPRDALAREQSLFEWMFELERFCSSLLYPQAERDHWLNNVRHIVLNDLSRPYDVEELAALQGLSRSHFSHRFKAATGLSPAAWVQQIRLDEVARRLVRTDHKLERIARDVGLGDANHLCKVFRRRFHLSPGEFRRQMK